MKIIVPQNCSADFKLFLESQGQQIGKDFKRASNAKRTSFTFINEEAYAFADKHVLGFCFAKLDTLNDQSRKLKKLEEAQQAHEEIVQGLQAKAANLATELANMQAARDQANTNAQSYKALYEAEKAASDLLEESLAEAKNDDRIAKILELTRRWAGFSKIKAIVDGNS